MATGADGSLPARQEGYFAAAHQGMMNPKVAQVSRDDIISLKYQRYPSRVNTEANLYLTSGSGPQNFVGEY